MEIADAARVNAASGMERPAARDGGEAPGHSDRPGGAAAGPAHSFPLLDAARTIIRAELDLYHAQHGHPRPVTICDLESGYDAARRVVSLLRSGGET